jgi:hypothetical protein
MDNFHGACPARMNDSRFITDYRNPTVRERENKKIFGSDILDDKYRESLQKFGFKLSRNFGSKLYVDMTNTCATNTCIHTGRTRVVNKDLYNELKLYNNVRTGKLIPSQSEYPKCSLFSSYKLN